MMYGWGGDTWGIVGWITMGLLMLLFWGVVVAVIIVLLRHAPSGQGTMVTRPAHEDAELILNERFARGEIDEPEYLARRSALRGTK